MGAAVLCGGQLRGHLLRHPGCTTGPSGIPLPASQTSAVPGCVVPGGPGLSAVLVVVCRSACPAPCVAHGRMR